MPSKKSAFDSFLFRQRKIKELHGLLDWGDLLDGLCLGIDVFLHFQVQTEKGRTNIHSKSS